jgi:Fe2+ transport system protein FeoA
MANGYVICPLCGFEFEKTDTICQHGCPMMVDCKLTRCPSCDYEFPEKPAALSWLERVLKKKEEPSDRVCDQFVTLQDLDRGERVEVVSLSGDASRNNTLTVFGLAPGSEVTLIQRQPAFVIRIGETELALDAQIAREIVVKRPEAAEAGG